MAADFFVVPTATCRVLFVLVMLAHNRRRVVHVAVTAHPTAAWTAQQSDGRWDQRVRLAAFDWLDRQRQVHGDTLRRDLLIAGFTFEDQRVPLISPSKASTNLKSSTCR